MNCSRKLRYFQFQSKKIFEFPVIISYFRNGLKIFRWTGIFSRNHRFWRTYLWLLCLQRTSQLELTSKVLENLGYFSGFSSPKFYDFQLFLLVDKLIFTDVWKKGLRCSCLSLSNTRMSRDWDAIWCSAVCRHSQILCFKISSWNTLVDS